MLSITLVVGLENSLTARSTILILHQIHDLLKISYGVEGRVTLVLS